MLERGIGPENERVVTAVPRSVQRLAVARKSCRFLRTPPTSRVEQKNNPGRYAGAGQQYAEYGSLFKLASFEDLKEGNVLEAYRIEEVVRSL